MIKISINEYIEFKNEYFSDYKNIRFGQAFCNKYLHDISDPNLFYADFSRATEIIFQKYVKKS